MTKYGMKKFRLMVWNPPVFYMARGFYHTFVKKSGNSESIKCEDRANLGKCHTEDGTRRFQEKQRSHISISRVRQT